LPLIIFWNAATGHPHAGADFAFAIVTSATFPALFRIGTTPGKSIVSFLSILALSLLSAPDDGPEPLSPTSFTTEPAMKHFMIKYQFAHGITEEWHQEIGRFISALNADPDLKGRIVYRCMKTRDDSSYTHLAAATDEEAIKTLQSRDFFKHYTEKTREVADGDVVVTPMELIAETA
jgi:hypothetical protein